MRSLRTAAVACAAALTVAPLAGGVPAASARPGTPSDPLFHQGWVPRDWFSPNGDKSSDKARVYFQLSKKARVSVKVRRANKVRTLVFKEDLGKLRGRGHVWKWNGKDLDRDVVRDGKYSVTFVGTPVGKGGKGGKKQRYSTTLWADTKFNKPASTMSLGTVYPQTTIIRDAVEVRVAGKSNMASVRRVDYRVRDAQGRLVLTGHRGGFRNVAAFPFDGRDGAGAPLPGGTYVMRFTVKDEAGNEGKAARLTVTVDDKPLVEKVETVVVRPTGTQTLSGAPSDTTPPTPSTNPLTAPCGTVVPSTVYATPGAQSYRSADWCTYRATPHMAWAEGRVDLDTLTFAQAPRGLYSWQVSMRGRPTVSGETDTAELHLDRMEVGVFGGPHTHGSVSPATTEESVTSTPVASATPLPTYAMWDSTPYVRWVIATHGVDSYDVADVTVRYSYLTQQP
jgi:flagellar hook assembly protein FlgD